MTSYENLTSENIQGKYRLPKVVAKQIVDVKKCMSDPNSTLNKLLEKQEIMKKKTIKKKISSHDSRLINQKKCEYSDEQNLYKSQMRKYCPLNSSLSAVYRHRQMQQKIEFDKIDKNKYSRKQKYPAYSPSHSHSPSHSPSYSPSRLQKKHKTHLQTPYNSCNGSQIDQFHLKLQNICRNSESLGQNSHDLKRKVRQAFDMNDICYQKISEHTHKIFYQYEKHRLEEQFSQTYLNSIVDLHLSTHKLINKRK